MFGCGLPVAAKNFPALPELVKDGINGVLFDTPEELSDRIVQWFEDFHSVSYERRRRPFATHIERFRAAGWPEHWQAVALPVFQGLL
jgi:beta-1,4-mannosyltransferase